MTAEKLAASAHFPVSVAYLCEDCHCVGNCPEQCPACASQSILALGPILNRERPDAARRVEGRG